MPEACDPGSTSHGTALLSVIVILSVSLALAAWIYDAGRRIAGFQSNESGREILSLRAHLTDVDAELAKLRSLAGSRESSLQMEGNSKAIGFAGKCAGSRKWRFEKRILRSLRD